MVLQVIVQQVKSLLKALNLLMQTTKDLTLKQNH